MSLKESIVHVDHIPSCLIFSACEQGYYGRNCDLKCPPLFFGLRCQWLCDCSEKDCDYINGCRQITEGIFPKK